MNCQECREAFAEYLEGLLDLSHQNRIETHLAECPACQAELKAVQRLTVRLTRVGLDASPISLETAVMDRILHAQAQEIRRLKMRKRIRILGMSGLMATAIAAWFVVGLWFTPSAEAQKAIENQKASEALAKGADAAGNPKTVHIVGRMRSLPQDNFSAIDAQADMITVQVWKQFGDQPKWRVEKLKRVAVMDGQTTLMLIRDSIAVKIPNPTENAWNTDWLLDLTNVQDLMTNELKNAQAKGWELKKSEETTETGEKQIVVVVESKAKAPAGDHSYPRQDYKKLVENNQNGKKQNLAVIENFPDYLHNTFFHYSDMRRVYRFDAATQRLKGMDAIQHRPEGDLLVWTIERIEYDQPIDPSMFTLELSKDVVWYKEPEVLSNNEKYQKMSPKETAQAFFEACGKNDWDEVGKFELAVTEQFKRYAGGLELISLGEPFQSKLTKTNSWFVPYEIKIHLKNSYFVRKDNPAKRCMLCTNLEQASDNKTFAEVKELPDNAKYEAMTPEEAVQAFLDAGKAENWDEAQKYLPPGMSAKKLVNLKSGQSDIHIGKAVETKVAGVWEVPIVIGCIKKHNLALRNDNPAKRYIVDGGF
jgi:transposase